MLRILVIEREYGAGAAAIAEMAARRLGWKLLDHALTEQIARLAKVSPEICAAREGKVDSWAYRLAKVFWRGSHERAVGFPDGTIFDAEQLFRCSEQVISRAAEEGNCVMVGRGAPYFLRDRSDTFCVFLYAPRELKYRRVLERVKNEQEALNLVDTVDEERRQFIRRFYNAEWPARHLYHAMLNTTMGDDATLEVIIHLMDVANKREAQAK